MRPAPAEPLHLAENSRFSATAQSIRRNARSRHAKSDRAVVDDAWGLDLEAMAGALGYAEHLVYAAGWLSHLDPCR